LTYAAARFEEDPKLIDKAKQVRKTWLATPVLEWFVAFLSPYRQKDKF
jgi:hypothetical protein